MGGTVGFMGLGAMGGPMAQNLLAHGFALVVHDVDPAKAALWRGRGAVVAGSAADVSARADRTICMVETTAQAEDVIAGERGIIHTARPDAPVSGGTERAASGELSIIVGGAAETVAACQDLFRAMGARVFHMGALGQGLAMKLVNNMLIQVNTVAVAEALVLGVKAGLDPRAIHDVVRVSTGNSWAFESSVPRILRRDFSPGGTVDIAFKDQELETAFAKQLGVPVLLANVTQQVYQMARAAGLNKEDGSAVIKVLEQLAGVRVGGEA